MKIRKFSTILVVLLLFFGFLTIQINGAYYISIENEKKSTVSNLSISDNVGCEWNRTWGGDKPDVAIDMKIDSSNNIYITGATDFKGAGMSLFLLKYNSLGDLQWNRTWSVIGKT
ncbi:MAG: hypothetical protein ACFFG0_41610, partial [Candidatus Thorarchaeota archaeon]